MDIINNSSECIELHQPPMRAQSDQDSYTDFDHTSLTDTAILYRLIMRHESWRSAQESDRILWCAGASAISL